MIPIAASIIIFFFGLAVGSFLNVVIIRRHSRETWKGRSHCVKCGVLLSWQELIPIASFLVQKTRCRHCTKKISWQYPLVELGTACAYLAGFYLIVLSPLPGIEKLLFGFGLALGIPAALVILVSDLRFQTIPDGATLTIGLLGLGAVVSRAISASSASVVWYDLGTALMITGLLGCLWFFSRGQWMGFGDVKLICAASLVLGFPSSITAFLFAFWSGGVVGVLLLCAGKKRLRSHIPFGPFILIGTVLAYFFSTPFLFQTGLGILLV